MTQAQLTVDHTQRLQKCHTNYNRQHRGVYSILKSFMIPLIIVAVREKI